MTKRIIDGKRYDTKTATLVAEWSNDYSCNDFKWCEEDLYRTPRGNWFTHGSGGPMSKYAESCGSGWSGSRNKIQALTAAEAQEWLERHDEDAALEEYFGASIEDA